MANGAIALELRPEEAGLGHGEHWIRLRQRIGQVSDRLQQLNSVLSFVVDVRFRKSAGATLNHIVRQAGRSGCGIERLERSFPEKHGPCHGEELRALVWIQAMFDEGALQR